LTGKGWTSNLIFEPIITVKGDHLQINYHDWSIINRSLGSRIIDVRTAAKSSNQHNRMHSISGITISSNVTLQSFMERFGSSLRSLLINVNNVNGERNESSIEPSKRHSERYSLMSFDRMTSLTSLTCLVSESLISSGIVDFPSLPQLHHLVIERRPQFSDGYDYGDNSRVLFRTYPHLRSLEIKDFRVRVNEKDEKWRSPLLSRLVFGKAIIGAVPHSHRRPFPIIKAL
jgi:hypothetical protein